MKRPGAGGSGGTVVRKLGSLPSASQAFPQEVQQLGVFICFLGEYAARSRLEPRAAVYVLSAVFCRCLYPLGPFARRLRSLARTRTRLEPFASVCEPFAGWFSKRTWRLGLTTLHCAARGCGRRPHPQRCSNKTCARSKKVQLIATNSFGNHSLKNRDTYCILTPKENSLALRSVRGQEVLVAL